MKQRYLFLLIVPVIAAIALAFNYQWFLDRLGTDETVDNSLDVELSLVNQNPGYVGAQVCGECHAARLAEFQETRHYRACWQPEKGPMPRGFAEPSTVATPPIENTRFAIFQSGNEHHETIIRQTPSGEKRDDSIIHLIYGSAGQGDEVYFTWKKNALFELPVSWLGPQQQWAIQAWADANAPGEFKRTGTTRCLECHNTWFQHIRGTENEYDPQSFLFGVTCERCHGPGREHVKYHRAHPNETTGYGLVNPANLTRDQQVDVCGQCHTNAPYRKTPLFTYRPGDKLEDHFRILSAKGIENDHVADQVKYMHQGKCFQESETLSCTTCHNPHRKSDPLEAGVQACVTCHQPQECGAHEQTPSPLRNNCVDCHMPRYTRVAVKFHTNNDRYVFPMRPRQHRIGIYPEATQEVLLNWYLEQKNDEESQKQAAELTRALQKHWLDVSESLQQEHLFVAAIGAARESLRIAPSAEAQSQLDELISIQTDIESKVSHAQRLMQEQNFGRAAELLNAALEKKPNHAVAHARLGTIYAILNQPARATQHLRRVSECDPDSPLGENMLGWLAYLNGNGEQAVEALRRADEVYPYTTEINFRLGLALLMTQRWAEAEKQFTKVLEIDPNHAGGCQGLSNALVALNKPQAAVRYARRAAQLSGHRNADVLLSLANAYAADGQRTEAISTAEQALNLALENSPESVPIIRKRLQEFRADDE